MKKPVERIFVRFFWIVPLVFYLITMAKTIGFVDAGLILNNAYRLTISAWVNNHNLFSVLGWTWLKVFPFGSIFFRVNLLSALFGVFTVHFIFLTCWRYSKNLWVSIVTALALMVSQSLWWHSTMLEVYTLNTFMISLIFFASVNHINTAKPRWLYLAAFAWGLGISNHILMALLAPSLVIFLIVQRKKISWGQFGIGILCLLAGMSLFVHAFIISFAKTRSFQQVFDLITGGEFRSLMFPSGAKAFWRFNYLFLIAYQYPSLAIFFLVTGVGLLVYKPQKLDLIILAALVPQVVWSANYCIWDMYAFSLPVYVILSMAVFKGLYFFREHRRLLLISGISLVIPLPLYPLLTRTELMHRYTEKFDMNSMVVESFDPARYFMNPNKACFNEVDAYIQALFAELPEGAYYYDNVYDYPLHYYYQNVLREREDIHCPVILVFWLTENEQQSLARQINGQIKNRKAVYLSPYVYKLLEPKLEGGIRTEIPIQDRTIIKVSWLPI